MVFDPKRMNEFLARSLRSFAQSIAPNNDEFAAKVMVNRGHLNEMMNKKVDPKLSMILRLTRSIGCCPNDLVCDVCARLYGSCVRPFDTGAVPSGARTLRDLHAGRPNRRDSDWS
jgi:hypothetical protein